MKYLIAHIKSFLLLILFLFFASLLLHFLFKYQKEGLADQEMADKLEKLEDEITPTMVQVMKDSISLETSRGYDQVADQIQQSETTLENIVTSQTQNNNSEDDNKRLDAIANIVDDQIEQATNKPIIDNGSSIIFKDKEDQKRIIGIVRKFTR